MRAVVLLLISLFPGFLLAQAVVLNGIVLDRNGEALVSAHVFISPDSITIPSDSEGRFSAAIKPGQKLVRVSFVGLEDFERKINVNGDTTIQVLLIAKTSQLQEVVITAKKNLQEEVFNSNRTSTYVLSQDDITALPVLGGEADVIKVIQLLPGTVRGVEGSSDLFVRGGAADQNLVLLDEVPIYNTSHMLGFLSVFNPDILSKVEAINGGFPAEYGGRLSSILKVQTRDAIPDQTHMSGDVGIIASRLFIEQPLVKNKASVWLAGRRTYIDQVVKTIGEELPYFFYDLNGKLTFQPSENDRISLSYYSGEDVLNLFRDRNGDGNGFLTRYESGNNSQSLQWQHKLSMRWTSQLSIIRSQYQYNILNAFEENELLALSDIEDIGARWNVQRDSIGGKNGVFKSGMEWTQHRISPNVINTEGTISELLESSSTSRRIAQEFSLHGQYEWSLSNRFRMNTGIRMSMASVSNRTYVNPEPRIFVRYKLTDQQALKFSYSRMVQYLHRIANSAVTSPADIWYPVTETIAPQTSNQVALAWQRSDERHNLFLSLEGYYKSMNHLIGYEEGTNLFLNNDFESRLIQGKGTAYGLEFLLRKESGKLTGWISYTLSWSNRQFDEVNRGEWFPSRYDRRHNGAIVAQYALSKRLAVSAVWEFISGARFTPVIGQYAIFAPTLTGVDLVPIYSGINQVKLANTHRLDVGIKFRSRPDKKFQWHWFAGVYNGYNRANPIGITIEQDEDGTLRYEQPGLFGLLPFISYGFKF